MLPIRANANVNINENKPSDAREVLAYYIENNMVLTLYFMVLSTLRFCRFRQEIILPDKAQTTKGTIKLESMRL
jgi:hypothetical protein